jgi:hydroxymethylpyrimidine pyrophosphatase-like HAD family hydrolase
VLRRVPGTALASDQFCRLYDLAIDYREDVAPLADSAVMESVRIMEDAGMTAKVSSIHVNAWFGDYDKLTMTRAAMKELFGIDLDADNRGFVYTGDSPNDAPMFAHFRNSVGVANVMDFAGRIASMPNYITSRRSGDGFAELAAHLTGMRASAAAHSTGTADAPA